EYSIGRVHAFHGNVGVAVRAYAYLKALGGQGIRSACDMAVLAANYLRVRLQEAYEIPYNTLCKHEFVMSAIRQAQVGATAICKRLLDFGMHPPTVHFPLIVKEALMIEPTETECMERLDELADTLLRIAEECERTPEIVLSAPQNTPISRVDEVRAARSPVVVHPE
ncbi:MAG TPA: aminomethyl-transferring glycine dehydrogenase subunit GcvPB, partial [Clostridia bacterium]|nr:aminomethyl-transferring glycine dehydrogenase subunit GcvPB [Clostridia bacterium]